MMADELTCRAEKVTKRGAVMGKETSAFFAAAAATGFFQQQSSGSPTCSSSSQLPVSTYDTEKGAGENMRPPSLQLRGWESGRRGYVFVIISLLAIFALSGSFMFTQSLGSDGATPDSELQERRRFGAAYVYQPLQISRRTSESDELGQLRSRPSKWDRTMLPEADSSSSAIQDEQLPNAAGSESRRLRSVVADPAAAGPGLGCDRATAQLRVFMYDLPPEFHYGMIAKEPFPAGEIWPKNASELPVYPGGLYQQHSPEYWITSDLLTSNMPDRRAPCTAFRVSDWRKADVIFVPFFASLSYNKYSKSELHTDPNRQLQKKLEQFLKRQPAWQASGGVDHVIVIHHPNSMHIMRDELCAAMFVLADFGRYTSDVANIDKDIIAPYKHVVPSYAADDHSFHDRDTLLFFQGAIVRKEGGIIRQKLYELLKDEPGVHFESGNTQSDGIRSATQGMRSSKFCLHLAGDTPSSNRLFDAVTSHCVPVIISDEIELPYEDVLDYTEFCLFVKAEDALQSGFVINLLRSVKSDEWVRMHNRLQQVDLHFTYQHPTQADDAVHMIWKAIARKLPSLKFSLHKHNRYKRSKQQIYNIKQRSTTTRTGL
ncbi:hypothetical protein CY35_13G062600 [Sphagnum magellanicum]|nr:hypothetical protein CY35_13G062600 [Sphagnum magellanicum]